MLSDSIVINGSSSRIRVDNFKVKHLIIILLKVYYYVCRYLAFCLQLRKSRNLKESKYEKSYIFVYAIWVPCRFRKENFQDFAGTMKIFELETSRTGESGS